MRRLEEVDLSLRLSHKEGAERLAAVQRRLTALALQLGGQLGSGPDRPGPLGPAIAIVFEGWDASGKGGAIRRLTAALDPRHVTVSSFSAPSEEELRHHFLWRFHRGLPATGTIGVFDRSWYGRVLVERVEGLATADEVERAYGEIAAYEAGLAAEGTVVVKFWLHVSPEEQLRRFRAREKDPLKAWKLTDEDWRNRDKRPAYEQAVEEMLRRTDAPRAPWHVIAGESKRYARVAVLEAVVATIESGLTEAGLAATELGRGDDSPH